MMMPFHGHSITRLSDVIIIAYSLDVMTVLFSRHYSHRRIMFISSEWYLSLESSATLLEQASCLQWP